MTGNDDFEIEENEPQATPEGMDAQQGHGEFGDDQDGGYRPELVVEREIFEEEFGEPHAIGSPRQHH